MDYDGEGLSYVQTDIKYRRIETHITQSRLLFAVFEEVHCRLMIDLDCRVGEGMAEKTSCKTDRFIKIITPDNDYPTMSASPPRRTTR